MRGPIPNLVNQLQPSASGSEVLEDAAEAEAGPSSSLDEAAPSTTTASCAFAPVATLVAALVPPPLVDAAAEDAKDGDVLP